MDNGRETSVQTDIFLILTCHSFEHYLLNTRQSILHIISKILQSFPEEINSFKRQRKVEIPVTFFFVLSYFLTILKSKEELERFLPSS